MNLMKMAKRKTLQLANIKSLCTDFCGVDILQKDDILYSDDQDKANVLNHYFSTVFTKCDNSVLPNMGLSPYPDINGSELPGKLLKVMASEIAPCLSLVFAASLHHGTVPQDWKLDFGDSTI